jgi:hypothetical protein
MAVFGPNFYSGYNDLCSDNYTFSNSGLSGSFGSYCTIVTVVGGNNVDNSDYTCLNAAIADVIDDTGISAWHVFNKPGLVVTGGVTVTATSMYTYSNYSTGNPLTIRVTQCTGDVRSITALQVNYMTNVIDNNGSWSHVVLLPGLWDANTSTIFANTTPVYSSISFSTSQTTPSTVFLSTQPSGTLRVVGCTPDGSHDHWSAVRRPFVLGAQSGGYYTNTSYPSSISYSASWYNDLMMQLVPNLTSADRTIGWNTTDSNLPAGNPYTGNNTWPPVLTSGSGNWAFLDLVMTAY